MNRQYRLCEALRAGTTLEKRFASALESATIDREGVIFQEDSLGRRSIGIVVAEQIRVLDCLVAICEKYVFSQYFVLCFPFSYLGFYLKF